MAIERIPGSPSPEWDSLVKDLTTGDLSTGYAPERDDAVVPVEPVQYIPGMPALPTFEDFLGGVGKVDVPAEDGPLPAWLQSRPVGVTVTTVLPATLVTGIANLSAAQYAGWQLITTCGLITAGSMALAVAGFMARWTTVAPTLFLGLSFASASWLWAALGSGYSDVSAWLTFAALSGALSLMYISRTEEARATTRLIKAKSRVEDHKARAIDAAALKSQAQAYSVLMRTQMQQAAAMAVPAGPVFTGTSDEIALRSAVWDIHQVELLSCQVTPTQTGWTAVLSLPSSLSRKDCRTAWHRVASAMRLNGRCTSRDGERTNEVRAVFVDADRTMTDPILGWYPGASWAVIADSGESIPVPLGKRMLIAGTSGSGKSYSARPLLAEASEYADHRLVLVDLKQTEARNWQHRARIAVDVRSIEALTEELIREGERRLALIPRGQDVVEISPDRPRITVFVDEGGEVLGDCEEAILARFRTIARKYRAAEIILVWATQKPSLSGEGRGLDSQISAQLTHKLGLAVATPNESRVVFGEDAAEKGLNAHELPMPGWAYLRDIESQAEAAVLRMRCMRPADVIELPSRPIWFEDGDRAYEDDDQYAEITGRSALTPDERVAKFVAAHPGATRSEIAAGANVPKGSLSAILGRLQSAG